MGDATQAEESDATSGEGADSASSATATKASTAGGGGGAGVDLSKGIAFEAPKPKVLEPEQEEESDSKKVIFLTVPPVTADMLSMLRHMMHANIKSESSLLRTERPMLHPQMLERIQPV